MDKKLKGRITRLYNQGFSPPEILERLKADAKVPINLTLKLRLEDVRKHLQTKLYKENDRLWSKAVRKGKKCFLCGGKVNHAHHLIGRGALWCRWLMDNGLPLCYPCHQFGAHGATNKSEAFLKTFKAKRPKQWLWYEQNKDEADIQISFEFVEENNKRLRGSF